MKFFVLVITLLVSLPSFANEIKIAKVSGYDIEYEMIGTGGVTVLLEAGGSASLRDWDTIYYELGKHFLIIRYSRIGNGGSSSVRKITAQMNTHRTLAFC